MSPRCLLVLLALVGCESTKGGGGASGGSATKVAESGTKRGSAGGFSATMAQELGAPEGSLGAAAPGAAPPTAPTAGGSAAPTAAAPTGAPAAPTVATTAAPAGSAAPTAPASAGSAAAGKGAPAAAAATQVPAPQPSAGAVATKAAAPSGAAPAGKPAAGAPAAGAAPVASGAAPAAGAPAAAPAPAAATTAGATGTSSAAPGMSKAILDRKPVKPSAEIAAIKIDLEPNWDRDYGEAGTFSLVVKVPNTNDTRVFGARYGYEDPAAPVDCDQYRKFLEDKKVMTVTLNRQRGGACYIESKDSFRYLVNFGGKRLMCSGSLYKDAASTALGDLRDKVLMQAKKICETLAL